MSEFSLEMSVLRMLKDKKAYDRYAVMVPDGTVNDTTKKFIKRFGEFFEETGIERVTYAEFWPFLRTRYPKWKDKDVAFWEAATKPIDEDNKPGYNESVIRNLLATDLGNKALALIENWQGGGELELGESLREAVERYEEGLTRRVRTPDVTLDWDEMIAEDEHNIGFSWRLGAVGRHLRSLRPGDFGVIAMRPDRGKTSWIASEVTHMAPQIDSLKEMYPPSYEGERRPTLWLNNEGPGRRILARLRQAALGWSNSEIRTKGHVKARAAYIKLLGGDEDLIIVKDIHGFKHYEVEELIRKYNPALVVFDMIDNIQFAGLTMNQGQRTDQLLEAMYQWARMLAVKYGFAALATSQISADGEGERYPVQTLLKDSKTGKQGACDFILTGGFDPAMPNTRFIGTTKNKIKLEGATGNPLAQVTFDQDRSRFIEPKEIE